MPQLGRRPADRSRIIGHRTQTRSSPSQAADRATRDMHKTPPDTDSARLGSARCAVQTPDTELDTDPPAAARGRPSRAGLQRPRVNTASQRHMVARRGAGAVSRDRADGGTVGGGRATYRHKHCGLLPGERRRHRPTLLYKHSGVYTQAGTGVRPPTHTCSTGRPLVRKQYELPVQRPRDRS